MAITKTLVLAAATIASVAGEAYVTFYDYPYFQGASVDQVLQPFWCYNVVDWFNDRASSAQWQAEQGIGGAIGFFVHSGCSGTARWWSTDGNNFPNNFAIDGIDNTVSSVKFIFDKTWGRASANTTAWTPTPGTALRANAVQPVEEVTQTNETTPIGENK